MKESEIWDYLIKWGTARNPTLLENLEEWSDENFITLKTTLQQCLPLIRYFHISNIEIYYKIRPYKKILDKQLWEDIILHLVAPDRPIKSIILPARSVWLQNYLLVQMNQKKHFQLSFLKIMLQKFLVGLTIKQLLIQKQIFRINLN